MKTVPTGKLGATAPASQRRRAAACSARKTLSRCKASTRYQAPQTGTGVLKGHVESAAPGEGPDEPSAHFGRGRGEPCWGAAHAHVQHDQAALGRAAYVRNAEIFRFRFEEKRRRRAC